MGFTSMSTDECGISQKPIHFCNARMRFFISFFLAIRSPQFPHFESFRSLSASLQEIREFVLSVGVSSLCGDSAIILPTVFEVSSFLGVSTGVSSSL